MAKFASNGLNMATLYFSPLIRPLPWVPVRPSPLLHHGVRLSFSEHGVPGHPLQALSLGDVDAGFGKSGRVALGHGKELAIE